MSKHEKHVRRERKKTDRARRSRLRISDCGLRNGGAAALAAAAAIAAGTAAYASPVRYDNPPGAEHFDWFGPTPSAIWLDFALPASSQPGPPDGGSSVQQSINDFVTAVGGGAGVQIQVGGYADVFLVGVDSGDLIPSGLTWRSQGYAYYSGFGSELPEGQQTYLGVSFDLGSGNQYGWIGVERTGRDLDAFAWGYETEVGVHIPAGIPEPGTLALLALGAGAATARRRREA